MASLNNSINMQIFAALKVAEKVKDECPFMLIGNPGIGKTKTVELFSEVRGYELILVRGNSESPESILGYPIAPTDTSVDRSTIRLRPDWFQNILDNDAKGKKSLLFLDEITTANDYVQAALLHLVFERMVGRERLPESTLIVSAGNYANNLSNSMIMLPPLMNRFCIYNIVPEKNDLDMFLCKYTGSISGNRKILKDTLMKAMKEMDEQEKEYTKESVDKIGEYIERQIKLVTEQLMTSGDKVFNPKVTELSNIYSDLDGDETLPGFITYRTLNYLRDVTVASFICFGKDGIVSKNYLNMVNGLVGLALSRDENGEVKKSRVAKDYYDSMAEVIGDIEKMNNNKLPEYENFFKENIVSDSAVLEAPVLNTVINKLNELKSDNELSGIERPIDSDLVSKINGCLIKSSQRISKYKVNPDASAESVCPVTVEQYAGDVVYWNLIATLATEIDSLVNDPKRGYDRVAKDSVTNTHIKLRKVLFKIKTIKRLLMKTQAALVESTAEIKSF